MTRFHFITFGTYCNHVPGDKRGAFHRNGESIQPNRYLEEYVRSIASGSEISFNTEDRRICFQAIIDRCYEHQWTLGALNVRAQHTHVLIYTPNDVEPSLITQRLKTLASARLHDHCATFANVKHIWERGYNAMNVKDFFHWARITKYILLEQHGNEYLTETEWREYSEKWVANPFGKNTVYRGLTFDGKTLNYTMENIKRVIAAPLYRE